MSVKTIHVCNAQPTAHRNGPWKRAASFWDRRHKPTTEDQPEYSCDAVGQNWNDEAQLQDVQSGQAIHVPLANQIHIEEADSDFEGTEQTNSHHHHDAIQWRHWRGFSTL